MHLENIVGQKLEVCVNQDGEVWIATSDNWFMMVDSPYDFDYNLQLATELCKTLSQLKASQLRVGANFANYPSVIME